VGAPGRADDRSVMAVRIPAAGTSPADRYRAACRPVPKAWYADGRPATVTIPYTVTMGVRHPASPVCDIPASVTWDGPAMTRTRQAHAAALEAAVQHAAAAETLLVEAETLATRYRLRAIEDRWIPRLEEALAEVTLALEEQELADAARLRLAVSPGRRREAR
jgi:vacuolar-type H+-ATPase subunit D/Vma8